MRITALSAVVSTAIIIFGAMSAAKAASISFASDTSWSVTDASAVPQGNAQYVCLNSSSPLNCPIGATSYSFAGNGWSADLSSIPGANWIWASGITGTTPTASLAQYTFSKELNLLGSPASGSISVAADDFAKVYVNNNLIGYSGSISDSSQAAQAQAFLQTFSITPFLVSGKNIIQVVAQNGPGIFAGIPGDTNYKQNPSGVVFGGLVTYEPVTAIPEPTIYPGIFLGIAIFLKLRRHKHIQENV
ncbi:MAG: PEP-CTERM sorting domain-containing protein [Nostoc sp. NOS(2021)]|uniref:PEP-CTERM sorting domain-containing protein n=1 Tax=Nostoc sp. NOS(2021) TaxID=2815407 RepID=UPI0025FBC05B|nr:PEP-CTERM sorting domain-containing protein [Nostoc sp. NOS(2021)]MBN3894128.1 PEP-CTERM sorting domain-containing protein [Nostoc sp. NOS(2021)]